jgi:hypothetical protein
MVFIGTKDLTLSHRPALQRMPCRSTALPCPGSSPLVVGYFILTTPAFTAASSKSPTCFALTLP